MIRIHKPAPPASWVGKAARARATHCRLVTRYRPDYVAGRRKLTFDSKLYAHEDVKATLLQAQHDKCAFCESKFKHVAYGDIEHFRPKGGWVQTPGDKLTSPGYYWLAYDWDNLLYACQLCNSRHKGNLFPLLNPAARITDHRDTRPLSSEAPLFIHPALEDPEDLITFDDDAPIPASRALLHRRRAQTTIEELGLTRSALGERRRAKLANLKKLVKTLIIIAKKRTDDLTLHQLAASTQPHHQYASMARAYLRRCVSVELCFPIQDPDLFYRHFIQGDPVQ